MGKESNSELEKDSGKKNWDFMIPCIGRCAMLNTDIDRI
jgi:hypothetical protein